MLINLEKLDKESLMYKLYNNLICVENLMKNIRMFSKKWRLF